MARFVVPVLVLVALVGGYVVGQQPSNLTPPVADQLEPLKGDPGERVEDGLPPENARPFFTTAQDGSVRLNDGGEVLVTTFEPRTASIGRYVPADGGRMLDTTDGTLYAVSGDRWQVVASLSDPGPDPAVVASEARARQFAKERRRQILRAEELLQTEMPASARESLERYLGNLREGLKQFEQQSNGPSPSSTK